MKQTINLILAISLAVTLFIACEQETPALRITNMSFNTETVKVVEGTLVDLENLITIEGENIEQRLLEFTSTDEAIVAIDGSILTALNLGTTTVGALEINTGQTAEITVTVTAEIVLITIAPDLIEVNINETVQLTTNIAPENPTIKTVTWSVAIADTQNADNTSIQVADFLEISDDGLLKAKQRCDDCLFTATATADGVEIGAVNVSINYVAVTSITLDPSNSFKLLVGDTRQMEYSYLPKNASDPTISWDLIASTDRACRINAETANDYATIDESGSITGISSSSSCVFLEVSASHPDLLVPTTIDFEVVELVSSLSVLNENDELIVEKLVVLACGNISYQLSVSVSPISASNKTVIWSVEGDEGITINSTTGLLSYDGTNLFSNPDCIVTVTADDGSEITTAITVRFDSGAC